jgi:calcium-dependent protein kinase
MNMFMKMASSKEVADLRE